MQIVDGEPRPVAIKQGKRRGRGITPAGGEDHPRPAADPRRGARRAARPGRRSALGRGAGPAAHRLLRPSSATSGRSTTPSSPSTTDPETGEERETHRRPNLAPFADDPDCWLVASIEDYDLESGLARMGPIFRERVIAPPAAPLIATAADALAVTLNETGRVDLDHLAELLDRDPDDRPRPARRQRCSAIRAPKRWETADAYLSGSGPHQARRSPKRRPALDPQYARNVAALRRRAARGPPSVRHHRAARRAVDSRPPSSRRSPPR